MELWYMVLRNIVMSNDKVILNIDWLQDVVIGDW